MATLIELEESQLARLVTALTSNEKRLSVIVDDINSEVMARARADNEIRAEIAALHLDIASVRRALLQLVEALDEGEGQ